MVTGYLWLEVQVFFWLQKVSYFAHASLWICLAGMGYNTLQSNVPHLISVGTRNNASLGIIYIEAENSTVYVAFWPRWCEPWCWNALPEPPCLSSPWLQLLGAWWWQLWVVCSLLLLQGYHNLNIESICWSLVMSLLSTVSSGFP